VRAVKQEFNGRRQRERDKCLQLDWLKADRIAAKYLAPTLSSGPPSHPSQLHQEPGSPGSLHEALGDVYAEGACASPALYGRGTARCVWIVFVSGSWLCFVHAYPHHPHPPSTSEPLAHLSPPPLSASLSLALLPLCLVPLIPIAAVSAVLAVEGIVASLQTRQTLQTLSIFKPSSPFYIKQ